MKKIIMCSLLVAIFLSVSGMKAEAKGSAPTAIPAKALVSCEVYNEKKLCNYTSLSNIALLVDSDKYCGILRISATSGSSQVGYDIGSCSGFVKRINDVLKESGLR